MPNEVATEYLDGVRANVSDAEHAMTEAFNNSAYIENEAISHKIGLVHDAIRALAKEVNATIF